MPVELDKKDFKKAWEKRKQPLEAARRIDLFYWIDAHTKSSRHVIYKDGLRHEKACPLLGIDLKGTLSSLHMRRCAG